MKIFKQIYFVFLCFSLCGCPIDRPCGFGTSYIEILNLEADPLYYKVISDTKEQSYSVNYNQAFYLPYDFIPLNCSKSSFIASESFSDVISSVYTFYADEKMNKPLFSVTANELKEFVATKTDNVYKAVITQGKIQYLHEDDCKKIQPLNWDKRPEGYLKYHNLLLSVRTRNISPSTEYHDYEVSLNFSIINWLFFMDQSHISYQFVPSQVFILSNGKRIYLTPQNAENNPQDIFPDINKFWLNRKFIYKIPSYPLDKKVVYIGGISVNRQNLNVYEHQF